jgi:hypothetical protein
MTDRPDARQLLEIARAALGADVLPFLPPDKRLAGLMIANALAIAARELAAAPSAVPGVTVGDMRAGRHDGDSTLYQALLADARARTAISNPKYLDD